jgi:hypothetical protein
MALAVGAAIRVARINHRASREQRHRLCRSAVVPQLSELRIGVVQVAGAVEIAGVIATQVVAPRDLLTSNNGQNSRPARAINPC